MPVSSAPLASAQQASVILGTTLVLDRLDLDLNPGEFVVLLGGNGSGKSTLVRALLGLIPLSGGAVSLFGRPPSSFKEWHRVGYVPQRVSAGTGVPATVEEVVALGRMSAGPRLRRFNASDQLAVDEALDSVGLEALRKRRVSTLSGGQQQRVLIARAVVNKPDLLLLDEPVASVDLENQEAFAEALERFRRRDNSVLLVAHSLGVMEPLIDRSVVLEGGKVVYDGPPRPEHQISGVHHHHPEHQIGGVPHDHPEPGRGFG
jgi:zinc transport system ATP-binding protein